MDPRDYQEVFEPFAEWSLAAHKRRAFQPSPHADIGFYWKEWYSGSHDGITRDQRRTLAMVGASHDEQERLAKWLLREFLPRYMEDFAEAVPAALSDLANRAPFVDWAAFQEARLAHSGGAVRAPVVPDGYPAGTTIREVRAVAFPRGIDDAGFAQRGPFPAEALLPPWRAAWFMPFLLPMAWLAAGGLRSGPWLKWFRDLHWLSSTGIVLAVLAGWIVRAAVSAVWAGGVFWLLALLFDLTYGIVYCFRVAPAVGHLFSTLRKCLIQVVIVPAIGKIEQGSCGCALCLAAVASAFRAGSDRYSGPLADVMKRFGAAAPQWPITGRMAWLGWILPVALDGKEKSAAEDPDAHGLIKPFLSGPDPLAAAGQPAVPVAVAPALEMGYASDRRKKTIRCFHVVQALLTISDDWSRTRLARNAAAAIFSSAMIWMWPGARCMVEPPPAPAVVMPSGRAPDQKLWVTLQTKRPECFCVSLDSEYWAYRVARLAPVSANHARAAISMAPRPDRTTEDATDGSIFIVRRRYLWFRDLGSGKNAGRQFLSTIDKMSQGSILPAPAPE
jgi:hypothetical protein